jgi:hypothetical protein
MTSKSDFDNQAWESLLAAPWVAGIIIVLSDPSMRVAGELKAMTKAIVDADPAGPARHLVECLVADMGDDNRDLNQDTGDDEIDDLLDKLSDARSLIDSKCDESEATDLKEWVLGVAQATAEARREGGVLGIGATRVSEAEHEALTRIRSALGLS